MHRGESSTEGKIYVGDLPNDATDRQLEEAFSYYGPVKSVWLARNPPGFAFIHFEETQDAEDAVKALDGAKVCGVRIRAEHSRGRGRPNTGMRESGRRQRFDPNDRCYQCGERGHYAYNCTEGGGGGGRGGGRGGGSYGRRGRRYSRSRSGSRDYDRRKRSRSRSRGMSRNRDRSVSRGRDRSIPRGRDRSVSRDRFGRAKSYRPRCASRSRKDSRDRSIPRGRDRSLSRGRDRSCSRDRYGRDNRSRSRSPKRTRRDSRDRHVSPEGNVVER